MNLDELNFDLPPERIAQRPLAARDASRMLLLDRATGEWDDRHFREFPDLLRGDELIILNNARVLPARLFGRRGALSRIGDPDGSGESKDTWVLATGPVQALSLLPPPSLLPPMTTSWSPSVAAPLLCACGRSNPVEP